MFGFTEFKDESSGNLLSGHLTGLVCVSGCEIGTGPATSVPEPETHALMLAGLGVLVVVARRRHPAAR